MSGRVRGQPTRGGLPHREENSLFRNVTQGLGLDGLLRTQK